MTLMSKQNYSHAEHSWFSCTRGEYNKHNHCDDVMYDFVSHVNFDFKTEASIILSLSYLSLYYTFIALCTERYSVLIMHNNGDRIQ